jgi:hypothetical protein
MKLSEIKPNPNNPRLIKDDKFQKLVKSIQDFPEMMEKRPIVCVTDVDGKIFPLGGNMRFKALKEIGYKEIPDTWIQMADEWTEEQRKEFVIKDNVGFGEWDWEQLTNDWDVEQLEVWGLDLPKEKELNEEDLFDIELPFYTPSEIKPEINEIADINKTKELISKIELLNIENDLKEILKIRASFFTDFNFQKIADFYHKETEDIKEVFKDLGLVILAPKEAIEKGFINLKNDFFEL